MRTGGGLISSCLRSKQMRVVRAAARPPCPCVLTLRRELSVVNFKGFPVGIAEGLQSRSFRTLRGKAHDHFLQVAEGEPDLNKVPKGLEGERVA